MKTKNDSRSRLEKLERENAALRRRVKLLERMVEQFEDEDEDAEESEDEDEEGW